MRATSRWMIRWNIWLNEDEAEFIYQGPFDSMDAAHAVAARDFGRIDPWHDVSWSLRQVHEGDLHGVRYVEPPNGSESAS